jgi:hypothetical protein
MPIDTITLLALGLLPLEHLPSLKKRNTLLITNSRVGASFLFAAVSLALVSDNPIFSKRDARCSNEDIEKFSIDLRCLME